MAFFLWIPDMCVCVYVYVWVCWVVYRVICLEVFIHNEATWSQVMDMCHVIMWCWFDSIRMCVCTLKVLSVF